MSDPNLLDALRVAVKVIEEYEKYLRGYTPAQVAEIDIMKPLYAAVAKAEGPHESTP